MARAPAGDVAVAVGAALDDLAPEGALGVAVSGGGDSTALLLLTARWAAARGRRIEAATVDHRLRPESAAEAAAVARLCGTLGVPHAILTAPDLHAAGGNLSAAAREARITLLGGWARERGLAAVTLGHTLDDQAETVLMRLARGSGVEGLSAMAPARELGGTLWLRPLLEIRRQPLRAFLEVEGVAWAEDPTNEAPEYDRVKARRALEALASLGIDAEGLASTAGTLQRQRRVLERAMRALAAKARHRGHLGEAWLDPAPMAADERDTALRLLADTLVRVSGAAYRPRFRALAPLLDRLIAGGDVAATLAGCLIRRTAEGAALICREPAACAGPVPLAPETQWDRRWRVTAEGPWPEDAEVAMLGEAGLAELRRLAEAGALSLAADWQAAPREVRMTTPAVWSDATDAAPVLLASPCAGHVNRTALGPVSTVEAVFVCTQPLQNPELAAYGPAGSRERAP